MLISHRHKFIFIRCRKTASTSTEIFLSKQLGPLDVITTIAPRDEQIRSAAGGLAPQNTLSGKAPYYNHMPAAEVRASLGDAWDGYYKFCFERNPWDKVISLYFHRHKTEPRISFNDFLHSGEALDARNISLYTIHGQVAVDFVGRYEKLEADLSGVCARLDLAPPIDLVKAKSQFRSDRRHYRDFLTQAQRHYIDREFSQEIELHGYVF